MPPEKLVKQFASLLDPLADKARAEAMSAYLLHRYDFLGIPAPIRRTAVKELMKAKQQDSAFVIKTAELLWQRKKREYRYTAIDFLKQHVKLLSVTDIPAIKKLLQRDSWWETVDGLSGVIGAILLAEKSRGLASAAIMNQWIVDEDFWVRRSAILHQLGWRLQTDAGLLQQHTLLLSGETEFFIRKAIGWALRDYARWNPEWVLDFTNKYAHQLSNLSLREARKHL